MSRNSVFPSLSCGDRDLGVEFKIHLGSQTSSRVEAKNFALLSNFDGYLLELIQWPKGSQASCVILRGDSELLSRPCRKRRASSLNDGRILWFLSRCGVNVGFLTSYYGELREPLMWCQGKSGLHLSCEGERGIALESR